MSMLPGMTTAVAERLLSALGTPEAVFDATEAELKAITPLPRGLASAQTRYTAMERAAGEVEFVSRKNIGTKWYRDAGYPERMLRAERAPVIIYTAGDTDLTGTRTVGIVGTRHATAYGTTFTDRLVADLAERVPDIVIVSGLAYGIDVAAHNASLRAHVPTVAVVGHGLDRIYPAAHRDTAGRMVRDGGMIVSDYPHNSMINAYNFLERNRLVAALCDALVVVESGEQGGAIATARLAAKCGVPVFALPGRVTDSYSEGCNQLLTKGIARCLRHADDLIGAMQWPVKASSADKPADVTASLTADERLLLHHILLTQGCDNDTLSAVTDMPASKVMTLMIGLEMRGIVTTAPGNRYEVIQTIDPSALLTE